MCVCAAVKRQHKLQSFSRRFTHGLEAKCRSHTVTHLLALPSLCPSFSAEQHSFASLPVSLGSSRCPKHWATLELQHCADELTSVIIPLSLRCHLHHGAGSLGGRRKGEGDAGRGCGRMEATWSASTGPGKNSEVKVDIRIGLSDRLANSV